MWAPGTVPGSANLVIVGTPGRPPTLADTIERPVRVVVEVQYADRTLRMVVPHPAGVPELGAVPAPDEVELYAAGVGRIPRAPSHYEAALSVRALPGEDGKAVELTVVEGRPDA